MIVYEGVSKSYNQYTKAVDNLNLSIPEGKITGLLGKNGAGKTTTIKMTVGIYKPTEGRILINDKDIFKDSVSAKLDLGYVPDNPFITQVFTGNEYLNFIADIYKVSHEDRKSRIEEMSTKLKINDVLNNKIKSYSKGMKQKITIIASLLHKPKIWILDEPLNGLDPQSSFELKNFIKEYAEEGNTVIFSTHVLEVAEKICDHLIILDKSKLIFSGTIKDLRESNPNCTSLEDAFLNITS